LRIDAVLEVISSFVILVDDLANYFPAPVLGWEMGEYRL
jgi:hypothetical protein